MKKAHDKVDITGTYKVLELYRDLQPHEIENARRYLRGEKQLGFLLPIVREHEAVNLCPATGRGVFARILAGDLTYTGTVNYGAFGSGSTAFTSTSTQLNTEVYRKLCSGADFDGTNAYIDWYVASGDVANQTFNEFAAVIDGTASANTGQAISLLLTGGWVKSGSMFVSLNLSVNG